MVAAESAEIANEATRRVTADGYKTTPASILHLLLVHFTSNTLELFHANSESGEFGSNFIANKSFQARYRTWP